MNESNEAPITSISKARSIEEIADYWDTHSLDDHWDETHEVEFEVRVIRKHGSASDASPTEVNNEHN